MIIKLLLIVSLLSGNTNIDKVLSISANSENGFYKIKDLIVTEKFMYILDSGNGRIVLTNRKGQLIDTIGDLGAGDGELYNPSSMCLMKDKSLWVCDTDNGRLVIFKKRKFIRNIKIKGIDRPTDIIVLGNKIIVSNKTKRNNNKLIAVLDFNGKLIKYIDAGVSFNDKVNVYWNYSTITKLSQNSFLVGFKFYNVIKKIKINGNIETINMSNAYPCHKSKVNDDIFIPAGFCAMAFSKGPNDSIFISTCDFETKRCREILEFDLQKFKINKRMSFNNDSSIVRIKYYERIKLLVIIFGDSTIEFYKYH